MPDYNMVRRDETIVSRWRVEWGSFVHEGGYDLPRGGVVAPDIVLGALPEDPEPEPVLDPWHPDRMSWGNLVDRHGYANQEIERLTVNTPSDTMQVFLLPEQFWTRGPGSTRCAAVRLAPQGYALNPTSYSFSAAKRIWIPDVSDILLPSSVTPGDAYLYAARTTHLIVYAPFDMPPGFNGDIENLPSRHVTLEYLRERNYASRFEQEIKPLAEWWYDTWIPLARGELANETPPSNVSEYLDTYSDRAATAEDIEDAILPRQQQGFGHAVAWDADFTYRKETLDGNQG